MSLLLDRLLWLSCGRSLLWLVYSFSAGFVILVVVVPAFPGTSGSRACHWTLFCALIGLRAFELWSAANISSWSAFRLEESALYLGSFIGPGAGLRQWLPAVSKWLLRAKQISLTGAPPLAACSLYNSRALPCLGFLGQLFAPPPPGNSERRVWTWIYKFSFTALSKNGLLNIGSWGGCKVRSVDCTLLSTLVRSAAKTISEW